MTTATLNLLTDLINKAILYDKQRENRCIIWPKGFS
jgi:hypothetical protein